MTALRFRVAHLEDAILTLVCVACRTFLAECVGGRCRVCRDNEAYATKESA